MALDDAVLAIADAMEAECSSPDLEGMGLAKVALKAFAGQLRVAVKAAEGSQPVPMPFMDAPSQHLREIEKARMEFRRDKEKTAVEESFGERMAEVADGKHKGDLVSTDSGMPVGAKMMVSSLVHELRADGKLYEVKKEQSK